MSISSIGGQFSPSGLQDRLISDLKKSGLSDELASTAQSELQSVTQSALQAGGSGGFDPSKIREAVDKQLGQDVKAGKLTQDQSDQISKALDKLGQQFGPPSGAGGFQPPQGSGASGSSTGQSAASDALQSILQQLQSSSHSHKHAHASNGGSSGSGSSSQTDTADYLTKLLSKGVFKTTA